MTYGSLAVEHSQYLAGFPETNSPYLQIRGHVRANKLCPYFDLFTVAANKNTVVANTVSVLARYFTVPTSETAVTTSKSTVLTNNIFSFAYVAFAFFGHHLSAQRKKNKYKEGFIYG